MAHRRDILKSLAAFTGGSLLAGCSSVFSTGKPSGIACQYYTWFTFYRREGKSWMDDSDASLEDLTSSGLSGYEPSFDHPDEVFPLMDLLGNTGISVKSMYVNSVLHEPLVVEQNIENVLKIARLAVKSGIRILVTNPTPISWNGLENKTDEHLKTQAIALSLLGKELKSIGMTLAYHNHDAEMREGAREFHHMLAGTNPDMVKLCFDPHWIYRGSGNSQVALFDILELYGNRIVEVHLRQSRGGVWSEVFGTGDIDYDLMSGIFKKKGIKPLLVLEQAVEEGTPYTMGAGEAIKQSLSNMKQIFKGLY